MRLENLALAASLFLAGGQAWQSWHSQTNGCPFLMLEDLAARFRVPVSDFRSPASGFRDSEKCGHRNSGESETRLSGSRPACHVRHERAGGGQVKAQNTTP